MHVHSAFAVRLAVALSVPTFAILVPDAMALDVAPVVLPPAAEPIVLPVPPGAVKVMPRWAEEELARTKNISRGVEVHDVIRMITCTTA